MPDKLDNSKKSIHSQTHGAAKEEDYVFRFPIELKECSLNPDTVLIEFYKEQLQDLFKIIFLSKDGVKIIPNEFGFLNEPEKKYPLWKEKL